ncbi:hypothetical protein GCM10010319_56480 [Streptomyces blastmyceticus]|uniref:Uncharacterized protein n=1 Tax=Streptomyces blastmyceticus TaxID=68180 RepID=A0ABN0XRP4_9ACTN
MGLDDAAGGGQQRLVRHVLDDDGLGGAVPVEGRERVGGGQIGEAEAAGRYEAVVLAELVVEPVEDEEQRGSVLPG